MRKEDKARLPPVLKVKLPLCFYIIRAPGCYRLYYADTFGEGRGHFLVAEFPVHTTAEEIERCAKEGTP